MTTLASVSLTGASQGMFWIKKSSTGVEIQWQELFQLFYICCDQLNYQIDSPLNATARTRMVWVEAPDSSQLISKKPNPQSSRQSAEFIYPGFIEEHEM